jgi:rod shape-determining protein MreC
METLLTRYRGLLVLVFVLAVQLVMLGVQVRNQSEVRLIRVWAVTAVTPFATILEGFRTKIVGGIASYVALRGARQENETLRKQLVEMRRQNEFLRAELETAQRADALLNFKQRILSRTIAARIIGANAAPASKVVFIDRGASDGLRTGMAVLSTHGVAGRVLDVYPNTSQVMLLTDPGFAMGVVSQKGRVVGTLKGLGQRLVMVDYVENHLTVEEGEWFYSSGDDRVFPRGLPVGPVVESNPGGGFQDIYVEPAGLRAGLDEVLIVLEAVHQGVPVPSEETPTLLTPPRENDDDSMPEVSMGETDAPRSNDGSTWSQTPGSPEHPAGTNGSATAGSAAGSSASTVRRPPATDADRLLERYRRIGESQRHVYGSGAPGSAPPDFNRPATPAANPSAGNAQRQTGSPATAAPAAPDPTANPARPSSPPASNGNVSNPGGVASSTPENQ